MPPLRMSELKTAISQMKNNKCPGLDGLPVEFYKMFWTKLSDILFDLYIEIIQEGEMHLSARQSVISLLEKEGKDPLYVSSWRPLSLLNVDNKIYGKILANRLQVFLTKIIHHSQTGFIKNRHLAENIIKILSVIDRCDKEGIDGFLISFDYLKAFDRLEWNTIFHALDKFHVGPHYIDMVKVLFKNPIAYPSNNGKWDLPIYPTRGCRQGCTYSPGIFVFTVEILALAIRQNDRIQGLELGTEPIKNGQFADDLWATLKNIESVNTLLQELDKF